MSDDHDSSRDIIRRMIDEHHFFQPLNALSSTSVEKFVNSFDKVNFEKGQVICRQKEEGQSVYVIESGLFDIYTTRRKQDGKTIEEFLVATIGGGIEFGMMEYQYDQPRLGTVVVSDESPAASCWKCEPEALAEFIKSNPLLSKRLRRDRVLYKTLKTTDLLNNIDEPNVVQQLIYTFNEERVLPGNNILVQGDQVNDDSKLYVLLDGEADAYIEKPFSPTIHSNSYKTGDSFGDMSFLYDCPRPFSVVASTACTILTLKKNQFESLAAKGSKGLRTVFDKHALHRSKFKFGAADEMYMSSGQFIDALHELVMGNQDLDAGEWKKKLALLKDLADRCSQGELIPFTEFIKRAGLMNKPHPEIEIAFRLFDDGGTGTLLPSKFREVMIDLFMPDCCPYNIQGGVTQSVFPQGETLDIEEFRTWLLGGRSNKKLQKIMGAVHDTYQDSYNRFRRLGTEDMLSEDGITSVRGRTVGVSPFPLPYLFAGGVAGIVSRTACYPLTRIKMLLQTGVIQNFKSAFSGPELHPSRMFQGNAANTMRIIPHMGLQFYTYESLTQMQLNQSSSPTVGLPSRFLCGGIAGLTALSLTFPMDVARARMTVATAAQKEMNYSTLETMLNLVKKGGVGSLFKGYLPAAAHVFPFVATEFATYEFAKNALHLDPLLAGAVAGAAATAVVHPLEVLRRRMQVQNFVKNQSYNYSGFVSGLQSLMGEGVSGMYRGFLPNMLRVAPAVGVSFASYEIALPFFRDMFEDHRFERNYHYPHVEGGH